MTRHFFDLSADELEAVCREGGLPTYAARQIGDWVYDKGITDPEAMTNVSRAHRARIPSLMHFLEGSIVAEQRATDDTRKLLVRWDDDRREGLRVLDGAPRETECVMIPTERRRTACLSSQVGCPVGCAFCASGIGGLDGNLTAGRIVEQVHRLRLLEGVGRITHVVFMGMGEPLANLAAVMKAIRALNAPWGFGISARRITVSTVGLPEAIRRFTAFEVPVTLALSLHAPNDDLRRELIPWSEYATIEELVDACGAWFERTGREITLEYLLLRGVNDRPDHAHQLAAVARRIRANVNLIRYNEVAGLPFERPATDDVLRFQEVLRRKRVNARIRRSRGRDIAAACGQLRHESRGSAGLGSR